MGYYHETGKEIRMKQHYLFRRALAALILCACVFLLPAFAEDADPSGYMVDDFPEEQSLAERTMGRMTLHEKVCQLFFVRPEHFSRLKSVTAYSDRLGKAFQRFPVGGVILFDTNITQRNLAALNAGMLQAAQDVNGIGIFIGVDEEGGGVSRVAKKMKLAEKQPNPESIGSPEEAYASGRTIGGYLSRYGFNLDFAPVADVRTDVPNAEISKRSFGSDPEAVARMTARFTEGLRESGIIPVLKHFPGHGAVSGNTHTGAGTSLRTREEWERIDFPPFEAGIQAGSGMVMISHQLTAAADPDTPASLSPEVIGLLRNKLGFDGVIITDALRMKAIHGTYTSGESCVLALKAGADMLLLPYNFTNAYKGVMKAVADGRLTEERINESVLRILALKEEYGLLQPERK